MALLKIIAVAAVYLLGVLGLLAFFQMLLFGSGQLASSSAELPMNSIADLEVSDDGHIFCALPAYARVQVYDASTGAFLYGWRPDVQHGEFRLDLDDEGNVEIVAARPGKVITYSPIGLRMATRPLTGDFWAHRSRRCDDGYEDLSVCYARKLGVFPRLVVKQGGKTRAITQSALRWLLGAPLPAFVFVAAALVTRLAAAQRRRTAGITLVALLSCASPPDANSVVGQSMDLAGSFGESSALLDTLFDPATGAIGLRGAERQVVSDVLVAIGEELGTFEPSGVVPERGVYKFAAIEAGTRPDWEFCRTRVSVSVAGQFRVAGPGRVRLVYCQQQGRRVLRAVFLGVSITNRSGIESVTAAQRKAWRIVSTAAARASRQQR